MQELIETYADQMGEVAVNLCQELVRGFGCEYQCDIQPNVFTGCCVPVLFVSTNNCALKNAPVFMWSCLLDSLGTAWAYALEFAHCTCLLLSRTFVKCFLFVHMHVGGYVQWYCGPKWTVYRWRQLQGTNCSGHSLSYSILSQGHLQSDSSMCLLPQSMVLPWWWQLLMLGRGGGGQSVMCASGDCLPQRGCYHHGEVNSAKPQY